MHEVLVGRHRGTDPKAGWLMLKMECPVCGRFILPERAGVSDAGRNGTSLDVTFSCEGCGCDVSHSFVILGTHIGGEEE